MGKNGALPWTEFTVAKAAKASKLGDYATIFLGKWHLGDLWNKRLPGQHNLPGATVSSPGNAGFDEWLSTQAEASNSMPNCGCFPVNHSHPGAKPPSGYPMITPHGDQCVVGGGVPSDWCYPCTNYYFPNASDPRGVSELQQRVPGDDSAFLVDHFDAFLLRQIAARRPWLAHLCFHAIHEPHPAMPQYYHLYDRDPDYLGALTMWDAQLGRLLGLLRSRGVADHTAILYTADNGPHQGLERSDIRWSTGFLRQCKASMWEGGIRVPGLMHFPSAIRENVNVTTPATSADFLPTIMGLLQVESDNPSWAMDGLDLLPLVAANPAPRRKPIGFDSTGGEHALIDENWKLLINPKMGQCDGQLPYSEWTNLSKLTLLFDLDRDRHELHDLGGAQPERLARMKRMLDDFLASVENSQANETRCGKYAPPAPPTLWQSA
jgi:arylsulfatase A-like enzyme